MEPAHTEKITRFFDLVSLDRRAGLLACLGFAIFSALLVSLSMPHGPATTVQVLIVMLLCLAVGMAAAFLWRSRWVTLLAPAAHIITLEIMWLNIAGPTVGPWRFDNTYGVLAFILGRGFYALVGLFPMFLGIQIVRAWLSSPARWIMPIIQSIFFIVLVVLVSLPASTPPILGPDGKSLPGSIAELATVNIGGHQQALLIRGQSVDRPVILYLSGGPGQSSLPHPRVIFKDIEKDFIMVAWDQRGTGKSYAALDPTSTLTIDQAVSDTIELTNYLRKRFDEDKIYLLGESWGTTLGVLAVQREPGLYHALISSGQMVSQRETDRRLYADILELAAQKGDTALAEKMRAFREPPYADIPFAYGFVMDYYDALYKPYTPPQDYIERGESANIGPFGVLGTEYTFVEKVNVVRGLLDMFTVLYPQIQDIDFRRTATRLEVPIYILDGAAELSARRDLALEWYNLLEAPRKQIFTFENAAHAVAFEQYRAFHKIMVETVLPETYHSSN